MLKADATNPLFYRKEEKKMKNIFKDKNQLLITLFILIIQTVLLSEIILMYRKEYGFSLFCGFLTVFIIFICFDMTENKITNPLVNYEPSYLVNKFFMHQGIRYEILQYVSFGQDQQSCYFKCRTCEPLKEQSIWYEEELKQAIANNDIKMEI